MKGFVYFALFASCCLFSTCQKVTKKVNSEKSFVLYFAEIEDETVLSKNVCFDKVYGQGRVPLAIPCSNTTEGIKLPLNIAADTSCFFFVNGKKTDTLALGYTRTFEGGGAEFEVKYNIRHISSSFKSLSTQCIEGITPECNGNQAFLSATIF